MAMAWRMTVVIPVFDEARSLPHVLAALSALPGAVEVIVVDDGSTDGTAAILDRAAAESSIVVVRFPRNRGKGAALRAGITRASAPIVVFQDADLEYAPTALEALVEPIDAARPPPSTEAGSSGPEARQRGLFTGRGTGCSPGFPIASPACGSPTWKRGRRHSVAK